MDNTSLKIINANYNNKISDEEMKFLFETTARQVIGKAGMKAIENSNKNKEDKKKEYDMYKDGIIDDEYEKYITAGNPKITKEKFKSYVDSGKIKTNIKTFDEWSKSNSVANKVATATGSTVSKAYGAANTAIKIAAGATSGSAALLLSMGDHTKVEKSIKACEEIQKSAIMMTNAGIIAAPNGLVPIMTLLIALYMSYGKDPLIKEALGNSLTICDKISDWVNDVRKNPDEYKAEDKIEELKHSIKAAADFAINILQFWADLPDKKENEEAYNKAIKNKRASVSAAIKKIMADKKAEATIFKNNLKNKISYITDTDDDKFKMVQNHVWNSTNESVDVKLKLLEALESGNISLDEMKYLNELL